MRLFYIISVSISCCYLTTGNNREQEETETLLYDQRLNVLRKLAESAKQFSTSPLSELPFLTGESPRAEKLTTYLERKKEDKVIKITHSARVFLF